MKKLKIASLFSGIGGFETGIFSAWGRENVEVVFASEIDKHASFAYRTVHHHAPHGDITQIDEKDVPDHDILVGGFPCQAFSIAGKREGFSDTRGTLFFDIARIAKEKQPQMMLLENVKGLVSHDGGRTLEVILQTLTEIGYKVDVNILNSRHYGVPQNRERIFIVAMKDVPEEPWVIPHTNSTFMKAKKRYSQVDGIAMFNFDFPVPKPEEMVIADILEPFVPEKYYLSEDKCIPLLKQVEQERVIKKMPVLDIDPQKKEMKLVGMLDMKANQSVRRVYDPTGLAPTLTTMGGGHREPKILVNELYHTQEDGKAVTYHYRVRKLTPLECFRLQGFPDEMYHTLRATSMSDTQLYKMAGNAVTSNVIAAIFHQLTSYIKR